MSPEIRFNNELVLDVPDESGQYMLLGKEVYLDLNHISKDHNVNLLYLWGEPFKGREPDKDTQGKVQDGRRSVPLGRDGQGQQVLRDGVVMDVRLKNPNLTKKVVKKRKRPTNTNRFYHL